MSIDPLEYYSQADFDLMLSESRKYKTPFLIFNLDILRQKYNELRCHFPYVRIHYAVKANPAPDVLRLLDRLGSNFDVASV